MQVVESFYSTQRESVDFGNGYPGRQDLCMVLTAWRNPTITTPQLANRLLETHNVSLHLETIWGRLLSPSDLNARERNAASIVDKQYSPTPCDPSRATK